MGVRVAALPSPKEDAVFGHTFELIIVLLVGLLIFGPKRVIEMGAAAGKMLRELRDAMKEMNWSSLTGADEHGSDPLAELRDLPRSFASSILNPPPETAAPSPAPTSAETTAPPAETPAASAPTPSESAPPHVENGSVPSADSPLQRARSAGDADAEG